MADVFLSYARPDWGRVERLAAALEAAGLSVWWDRRLSAGALFSSEIERELAGAAAVVVVWSAAGVESRWVKDEASLAADQGKLVTVGLDGTPPPLGFRQFHCVDLSRWRGAADDAAIDPVIAAVCAHVDRPAPERKPAAAARRPIARFLGLGALVAAAIAAAFLLFPSGRAAEASIAVLPFADRSRGGDQAYFADGLSEEILHLLATSSDLKVVGRTSSFRFKDHDEDLREIGQMLGAAHILEGSVRRDGDRVRVTAQLIRAADGFEMWSNSYDRSLTDILSVQRDIALEIARELKVPLGAGAVDKQRRQTNPAAYDHYLRGVALLHNRTDIAQAADHLQQAVALDPRFAPAWATLADAYIGIPGWLETYKGQPVEIAAFQRKAERAALRALELDPALAASHHALSVVYRDRWQWAQAEDAIERALKLEPNAAYILEDHQEFLENVGRWERSAAAIERAAALEPLNPFLNAIVGISRWHLRDYDGAAKAMRRALELDPSLTTFHIEYAALLTDAGRPDEAKAWLRACSACDPHARQTALQVLDGRIDKYEGHISAAFGDYVFKGRAGGEDAVLDALEEKAANGELVPLAINNKAIASVRDSERFHRLVRDTGLADYWRERGWPSFCRPAGEAGFRCG